MILEHGKADDANVIDIRRIRAKRIAGEFEKSSGTGVFDLFVEDKHQFDDLYYLRLVENTIRLTLEDPGRANQEQDRIIGRIAELEREQAE